MTLKQVQKKYGDAVQIKVKTNEELSQEEVRKCADLVHPKAVIIYACVTRTNARIIVSKEASGEDLD